MVADPFSVLWTWPTGGCENEEKTDKGTCAGIRLAGLSDGETAALRKPSVLIVRVEQRGRDIASCGTRRRGYCIQINKEAGFVMYSWIKKMDLANL